MVLLPPKTERFNGFQTKIENTLFEYNCIKRLCPSLKFALDGFFFSHVKETPVIVGRHRKLNRKLRHQKSAFPLVSTSAHRQRLDTKFDAIFGRIFGSTYGAIFGHNQMFCPNGV